MTKERPEKISVEDWKELEKIAFITIQMYLVDQILVEVCTKTTAKGLWERLKNTYMGKNMMNKL